MVQCSYTDPNNIGDSTGFLWFYPSYSPNDINTHRLYNPTIPQMLNSEMKFIDECIEIGGCVQSFYTIGNDCSDDTITDWWEDTGQQCLTQTFDECTGIDSPIACLSGSTFLTNLTNNCDITPGVTPSEVYDYACNNLLDWYLGVNDKQYYDFVTWSQQEFNDTGFTPEDLGVTYTQYLDYKQLLRSEMESTFCNQELAGSVICQIGMQYLASDYSPQYKAVAMWICNKFTELEEIVDSLLIEINGDDPCALADSNWSTNPVTGECENTDQYFDPDPIQWFFGGEDDDDDDDKNNLLIMGAIVMVFLMG